MKTLKRESGSKLFGDNIFLIKFRPTFFTRHDSFIFKETGHETEFIFKSHFGGALNYLFQAMIALNSGKFRNVYFFKIRQVCGGVDKLLTFFLSRLV